jgi:hypothetical protein
MEMAIPSSGIKSMSIVGSGMFVGSTNIPPVFLVVLAMPEEISPNCAPQWIQTLAKRSFLFLQTGQNFSCMFKLISKSVYKHLHHVVEYNTKLPKKPNK